MHVVRGHKGIRGFTITSQGKAGHSSGFEGHNSNWALIPVLQLLSDIRDKTLLDPSLLHHEFSPNHLSWNAVIHTDGVPGNVFQGMTQATVILRPMPGIPGSRWDEQVQQMCQQKRTGFPEH